MRSTIMIGGVSVVKTAFRARGRRPGSLAVAGAGCLLVAVLLLWGPFVVELADAATAAPGLAASDPLVVGPPIDFSGTPVYGPTWGPLEQKCAVAFNGTDYLVVWQSRCDEFWLFANYIYGARVDQSGAVLDEGMIRISSSDPSDVGPPAVASDGTNFMVVWRDDRDGPSHIYGARVDASGNVLDPGGMMISSGPDYEWSPSVAFDGTNYLVVWSDGADKDIHGARVDPSGTVLDPGGFVIAAADGWQEEADVAFGETNYLVVWEDGRNGPRDIYGARVDPSGTVLDPAGIQLTEDAFQQYAPAVAFGGTGFTVVWEHNPGGNNDIYGARVTQEGAVLDPGGYVITDAADWQTVPDIAFDGTNFGVVWEDRGSSAHVYGARVTTSAVVMDPAGLPILPSPDGQFGPAVAFDGVNYMVCCQYDAVGSHDIGDARLAPSGAVLDPEWTIISTEKNHQSEPAAAFDGVNYLVVWEDGRATWDIYGTRVDPTGAVLDPDRIFIASGEWSLSNPKVAFDGTNYLVIWEDAAGISGARVTPSGIVLDPGGIVITAAEEDQRFPAVAFDGANYMVVWQDGYLTYDIYGARVTPSGTVLDPGGMVISDAAGTQQFPALAFDGTNYLVVWEDGARISGARVTPSGEVLDPAGKLIAGGDGSQGGPAIAFDGTNYMVVWQHEDGTLSDIHGARVDQSGTVLDAMPIVVSSADGDQHDVDLVFNGTDYVAVWADFRNGLPDIYVARINPSGTVLDPTGVVMPAPASWQYNPAIASGNSDEMLVAYSSDDPEHVCGLYGLYRTMGNILNPPFILEATVELDPRTLNLKSSGKYVTAYIELPEGYDVAEIDVGTVVLNGVLHAEMSPTSVGDNDADGIPDRMVKFSRSGLIDLINGGDASFALIGSHAALPAEGPGDEFEVTVGGELADGTSFAGSDLIRVIGAEGPGEDSALRLDVVPNVIRDVSTISYEVATDGPVTMQVFDVAGRLVRTLASGTKPAGGYEVVWDRTSRDGSRVGAGVYFIRLEHQGLLRVRKVLVVQ